VVILPDTRTLCCAFKEGLVYDHTNDILTNTYYITQYSEENSLEMMDIFHYNRSVQNQWMGLDPSLTPCVTDFYLGDSHCAYNFTDLCAIVQVHNVANETPSEGKKCPNHDKMYPFCVCSSNIRETDYRYEDLVNVPVTRIYMPIMEPLMTFPRTKFANAAFDLVLAREKFQKFYRTYIKHGSALYSHVHRLPNLSVNFK